MDLITCNIYKNKAQNGAGIYVYSLYNPASSKIVNSNIYDNEAIDYVGGMIFTSKHNDSSLEVINSNIYGNIGKDYNGIYNGSEDNLTISHSNIQDVDEDPSKGIISKPPLFKNVTGEDYANYDFSLQSTSPCINTGTTELGVVDLDGDGVNDILKPGINYFGTSPDIGSVEYQENGGSNSEFNPTYDINGDGKLEAFQDGILIVRYLFGLLSTAEYKHWQDPNNYTVYQVIDENSTRNTFEDISSYLDNLEQKGLLDIDDNGKADALTDGLLLMRYMDNYQGEELIDNAVDINAKRRNAEEIVEFIENAVKEPTQSISFLQKIPLHQGWNLISFSVNKCFYVGEKPIVPMIEGIEYQELESIDEILLSIKGQYKAVKGIDQTGEKVYYKDKPISDSNMKYMAAGYGYWIYINEEASFNENGLVYLEIEGETVPADTKIPLHEGENLVGYFGNQVKYIGKKPEVHFPDNVEFEDLDLRGDNVDEEAVALINQKVFKSIENKYQLIRSLDKESAHTYNFNLPQFSDFFYVGPGYGYIITVMEGESPELVWGCSLNNLEACLNKEKCESVGGAWNQEKCQKNNFYNSTKIEDAIGDTNNNNAPGYVDIKSITIRQIGQYVQFVWESAANMRFHPRQEYFIYLDTDLNSNTGGNFENWFGDDIRISIDYGDANIEHFDQNGELVKKEEIPVIFEENSMYINLKRIDFKEARFKLLATTRGSSEYEDRIYDDLLEILLEKADKNLNFILEVDDLIVSNPKLINIPDRNSKKLLKSYLLENDQKKLISASEVKYQVYHSLNIENFDPRLIVAIDENGYAQSLKEGYVYITSYLPGYYLSTEKIIIANGKLYNQNPAQDNIIVIFPPHYSLSADQETFSDMMNNDPRYIDFMNKVYDTQKDLYSGFTPFKGDKQIITLAGTEDIACHNGNPLNSASGCFISNGFPNYYPIIHEIGHNFGSSKYASQGMQELLFGSNYKLNNAGLGECAASLPVIYMAADVVANPDKYDLQESDFPWQYFKDFLASDLPYSQGKLNEFEQMISSGEIEGIFDKQVKIDGVATFCSFFQSYAYGFTSDKNLYKQEVIKRFLNLFGDFSLENLESDKKETYFVAAFSAAVGDDLRDKFRFWGFEIDDNYFIDIYLKLALKLGDTPAGIEIIEMNFSPEINPDNELMVSINGGVFSKAGEIVEIEFDWGDGQIDKQWFPASHTYFRKGNFDIKVTARDDQGSEKTVSKKLRLLSNEILTLEGQNVDFVNFPESYFDGSPISPARVVAIVDTIYQILTEAHHYSLIPEKITFTYQDQEDCGAYSNSRAKEIVICKGFTPSEYHPWGVYAHEMSHNMAGQNLEFLYLAEHGFSAFLDEHQAEVLPEYVYQTIKNNPDLYGINEYELSEMKKSNDDNREIQQSAYNDYVNKGKPFYLLQDDVVKATQTGQALSHFIFNLLDESKNLEALKTFNLFLKNEALNQIGFGSYPHKIPTETELATYIIAAYSIAFEQSLIGTIFNELNFSSDKNFYNQIYSIMENMLNKELITQEIYLQAGQNLFSTYLQPENADLFNILEPIFDVLISVEDENGQQFIAGPKGFINGIGNLELSKGYRIKVSSDVKLEITGKERALPWKINLKNGFNIIGFPNLEKDAMKVFSDFIEQGILEKVNDETGQSLIQYFGAWESGLGNLKAGEGYEVVMKREGVLVLD